MTNTFLSISGAGENYRIIKDSIRLSIVLQSYSTSSDETDNHQYHIHATRSSIINDALKCIALTHN